MAPPAASSAAVGAGNPWVHLKVTAVVGAGVPAVPNAVYAPKLRFPAAVFIRQADVKVTVTLKGLTVVAAWACRGKIAMAAAAKEKIAESFFTGNSNSKGNTEKGFAL